MMKLYNKIVLLVIRIRDKHENRFNCILSLCISIGCFATAYLLGNKLMD